MHDKLNHLSEGQIDLDSRTKLAIGALIVGRRTFSVIIPPGTIEQFLGKLDELYNEKIQES